MKNEVPTNNMPAGLVGGVLASPAGSEVVAPVWDKMGSCQTCMGLTVAFLALSLLVLGLGTNIGQPVLIRVGQFASVGFGIWTALHAIFFFARRNKPVSQTPARLPTSFVAASRGCGCSGRSG